MRLNVQNAAQVFRRLRQRGIKVDLLKAHVVAEIEACGIVADRLTQFHNVRDGEGVPPVQRMPLGVEAPKYILHGRALDLTGENPVIAGRIDLPVSQLLQSAELNVLCVTVMIDLEDPNLHGFRGLYLCLLQLAEIGNQVIDQHRMRIAAVFAGMVVPCNPLTLTPGLVCRREAAVIFLFMQGGGKYPGNPVHTVLPDHVLRDTFSQMHTVKAAPYDGIDCPGAGNVLAETGSPRIQLSQKPCLSDSFPVQRLNVCHM